MATMISQLNLITMMGCKRHDKILAFPSSCTRKVTSVYFPNYFNYNYNNYNSRRTMYHCTGNSLQKKNCYHNYDGDLFAADKLMMMMKPSVDKCTNGAPSCQDFSSRKFVDTMSRIFESLLTYGIVFTFVTMAACLYSSNSALAASYGRIGGSSSSSSFSSGQSSVSYYLSDDDDAVYPDEDETHTCTCDTSCTHCISCDIREKGYKQEEEEENNSCSCNCHSTCYFHKKVDHLSAYILLACIILATIARIIVEIENASDGYGTMLIFQVGVLDKKRILQRNLNNIAENADTSTLNGLNCALKEVVGALLQHHNSSLNYCYLLRECRSMESLGMNFQEIFNGLLQGFDEDDNTLGNVEGVKCKKQADLVKANRSVDNEYTMATIMVLATGHHSIPIRKGKGKNYVDSLAVLQTLPTYPEKQNTDIMATIMSQLNFIMMGCKRHDRVLGFPSCRTRQVTPINLVSTSFFKFTNHNNYNSRRLTTVYHCTSSGLQENYNHTNNDGGDLFATEKFTMMKPSVDKCTNPAPVNRNFVDTMSRILASLLTYGVVFTFVTLAACLYTSNSALAASYGRIGGSSSSSSYGQSSVSYYLSDDDDDDDADYLEEEEETCSCDISCSHCTHCISCEIREKGYKQDEEEGNNSCSCNCHSTCYFHKQVDQDYLTLACFILVLIAIITAPFLEDKKKH